MHCQLALPVAVDRLFDYRADDDLKLQVGDLVTVPFRNRTLLGVIAGLRQSTLDESRLKSVQSKLDQVRPLDDIRLGLAHWMAGYYHHPVGEVFALFYPGKLGESGSATDDTRSERFWGLTETGRSASPAQFSRAPRQAAVLRLLTDGPQLHEVLIREPGITSAVLRRLTELDLIEPVTEVNVTQKATYNTSEAQQSAIDAVQRGLFSAHLLEGVTSSGKTEVYLQLVQQALEAGDQVLVIVPEIGLTPQLLSRFNRRLSAHIAVSHSGMTSHQRCNTWLQCQRGEVDVLIGTRSALFTPLPRLGLIVVDEEHDASLKQMDGCRYSARDVAVQLANLADIPVMLGSATPSLESLHNALSGRYQHHILGQRVGGASQPTFRVIDLRATSARDGLSAPLISAMKTALANNQQILLFLNRRGFAPVLMCDHCGWYGECRFCDSRLTLHQQQRHLRCHHCGASRPLPRECPECRSDALVAVGVGTERLEAAISSAFPQTPVYRVDRDSTRRKTAFAGIIDKVLSGEPCILVGTQMLAKGHHFPKVTLVAVIDIDQAMFSADFRSVERSAQLLTQVAGRAGREQHSGTVLVQTRQPDHPLFTALLSQGYHRFARNLLLERQAAQFPPDSHFALFRAESGSQSVLDVFFEEVMPLLPDQAGVQWFGPMPAPMQRRAGVVRCQILLQATSRRQLHQCLQQWLSAIRHGSSSSRVRWSIDVDPQDMN